MTGSDSDDSQNSDRSNASSYVAAHIRDTGRGGVSIELSRQPVPDNAPPLPPGAQAGVYDVEAQQFHALDRKSRFMQWVKDKSTGVNGWVKHHKGTLQKGLVDFTPNILQTVADSMDEGWGKTGVQIAATSSQLGVGANDIFQEARKGYQGDPANPASPLVATAGALRVAATGIGVNNLVHPGSAALERAAGFLSGAALAMEMTHKVKQNPVPQQTPEQVLYQGQGHQVNLGHMPGQYPPGNSVSSLPDSSGRSGSYASSDQHHPYPTNPTAGSSSAYAPPARGRRESSDITDAAAHGTGAYTLPAAHSRKGNQQQGGPSR